MMSRDPKTFKCILLLFDRNIRPQILFVGHAGWYYQVLDVQCFPDGHHPLVSYGT